MMIWIYLVVWTRLEMELTLYSDQYQSDGTREMDVEIMTPGESSLGCL